MSQPNAAAIWMLGIATGISIGGSIARYKSDNDSYNCTPNPLPITVMKVNEGGNKNAPQR
jgi:hypothetical protein